MRRIIGTTFVAILAFATVACAPVETASSNTTEPQQQDSYVPPPAYTPPPAQTDRERVVEAVRDNAPVLASIPDYQIVALAQQVCDTLDAGATGDDIRTLALAAADTPEMAGAFGTITGVAVSILCPWNGSKV